MSKIKYRKNTSYKYQLVEDFIFKTDIKPDKKILTPEKPVYIELDVDGTLTVKASYAWDGPSGPTIDTNNFMRGALVHDAIYQLLRTGKIDQKYRNYADRLLQKMCIEDGMSKFRAWYVYQSVDKFGASSAKPKSGPERKIYTAP